MIRILFSAAIVLFSLITVVASVDDVPGWQGARWGMTEEEVRAALEAGGFSLAPVTGTYTNAYVPFKTSIRIGIHDYEVLLQFSIETRRLNQVVLRTSSGRAFLRKAFSELQDLLTEKYGPAAPVGDKREWRFKTTIIELSALDFAGIISVRYYPASEFKSDKDKL